MDSPVSYGSPESDLPYDRTVSVNVSVEANEPGVAIEAAIELVAEQQNTDSLNVVEWEAIGPFSNLMRKWEHFPPNAELWDVYLRWEI